MMIFSLLLVLISCHLLAAFNPLVPTHGYTYAIEANREGVWPSCAYRFMSFSGSCDKVDLWNAVGGNQHWQFLSTGDADGSFYLKTSCGRYLSYTSDCNDKTTIDLWSGAGINQKFRFIVGDNTQFEYYIEAVGRSQCAYRFMSFPGGCTTNSPDKIDFWSATGTDQRFRIYPISSTNPVVHSMGSNFVCPDPYVWKPKTTSDYRIQCTGGGIKIGVSSSLEPTSTFSYIGDALGGSPAAWASADGRWAPENYESPDGQFNYLFFSDTQPDGIHRTGWVSSSTGPNVKTYTHYSSSYLNLGMAAGGDIDGHVFEDTANGGRTYFIWKTDDNNVGSKSTRIWLQELQFANGTVAQIGSPRVILDSTGLWWVDSWVSGGSLIEGPEMIKYGNYYYLFFAAGKYCQDTYTEGVARSTSVFGPFEKMRSPVLSNGIVGRGKDLSGNSQQLVGPGHAAVVKTTSGAWRLVWHASLGENCNRYAFISNLQFGADGWPYISM
jgi:arabinan endo-1,5-alpha-L-arabinosidase